MNQARETFKRIGCLLAALALMVGILVMPASAEGENDKVADATKGTFLVMYTYSPSPDPDAPDQAVAYATGTGFLVNETTVITAYHVLHHDYDTVEIMKKLFGNNYLSKMQIRVYYKNGAFVKGTEIQSFANSAFDFTAIKLAQPINGALQLKLAEGVNSDTLKSSTPVYALGYPGTSVDLEETRQATFTPKDVDMRSGIVSKFTSLNGIEYIKHSATTYGGMSGGPVVDNNGVVIGITHGGWARSESDQENLAVNIANVIDSLKQMNISYTGVPYGPIDPTEPEETTEAKSEGTTDGAKKEVDKSELRKLVDEVKALNSKKYSNWDDVKEALSIANDALYNDNLTQSEIDTYKNDLQRAKDNLEQKKMSTPLLIGIIAGAAILVVIVVVIIILATRKSSNKGGTMPPPGMNGGYGRQTATMPPAQNPPAPPIPPQPQQPAYQPPAYPSRPAPSAGSNETTVLGGSSETTVLGGGGNETTLLGGAPYAQLTRKSNNAVLKISSNTYVIGKQRGKVSYCIEDNTTVSRTHAQIVKNGATVSIIDLGSKNGTYVNGVKCMPNTPVDLKDGDKISISDEEFTINLI